MLELQRVNSICGSPHAAMLRRHGLTVECRLGGMPKDGGKLTGKTEILPGKRIWYSYSFDDKGRLAEVRRDNLLVEEYQYNEQGQRVRQCRRAGLGSGNCGGRVEERLFYDKQGRLEAVTGKSFEYDERGALAEILSAEGMTRFSYNGDTMLDEVKLPAGTTLRYEYAGIHPVRRYRYHTLTGEYQWSPQGRLVKYHDYDVQLEYRLAYAADGALDTVALCPSKKSQSYAPGTDWAAVSADWLHSMSANTNREVLVEFLAMYAPRFQPLTLRCGCDQVGSLRVLLDPRGDVVKEIVYDSFGQRLSDSFHELYMPLGFAGGLYDPNTRLVRFGWRDYDPSVGRFTAPDPARDLRGDGDLYDYCADDPVSRVDRDGRFFWPLLGGLAGGAAMGLGNAYVAARGADRLKEAQTGVPSAAGRDAVKKIAPLTALTVGTGGMAGTVGGLTPEILAAALANPSVSATLFDMWIALKGPALPPPSTIPGWLVFITQNWNTLSDNMKVFVEALPKVFEKSASKDILDGHTASAHGNSAVGKGGCSPATQPRDADGRFAPCEHGK